ncbi:hypothetical protein ACLOJK_032660, partial [Asimina triloba]
IARTKRSTFTSWTHKVKEHSCTYGSRTTRGGMTISGPWAGPTRSYGLGVSVLLSSKCATPLAG